MGRRPRESQGCGPSIFEPLSWFQQLHFIFFVCLFISDSVSRVFCYGKKSLLSLERCDGETRKTKMQMAQFEEERVAASKNAIEKSKER